MTIIEVAQTVVDQKQAHLLRYRADSVKEHGTAQYDCKPYGTGSKRGWSLLDLTTASVIVSVHKAVMASVTIPDERKAKFANIPLGKLIDFCWRMAA